MADEKSSSYRGVPGDEPVLHTVTHGLVTKPEARDVVQMMGEREAQAHIVEEGRPSAAGSGRALSSEDENDPDHPRPTTEELTSLRRVTDKLPLAAIFIVLTEFSERFTYYGLSGPFQNYIQFPYNPGTGEQTGAIDAGQQTATALTTFFQFFCYITPIFGAIIADQYLGKFRAITLFSGVYIVGLIILTLTSIPSAIHAGAALPGLIVSMIVIGFGTGGIKANVSPMVAEQYTRTKPFVKQNKKGEKVVVDPTITVNSIFNWFYWAINVGSLSAIATTTLERYVDFWPGYLMTLLMFILGTGVFILGRRTYRQVPPEGSIIVKAFRVIAVGVRRNRTHKATVAHTTTLSSPAHSPSLSADKSDEKAVVAVNKDDLSSSSEIVLGPNGITATTSTLKPTWLDYARPSLMTGEEARQFKVSWDDAFVSDLRRTLKACKVFLFYPVYWVCYSQITNNLLSQAATMNTGGVPNDIMNNIDPLALVVLIPIFDRGIYPGLRKVGINLKPIRRIFLGFVFAAFAMAYTAVVQHVIYNTGPNYDHPLVDNDGNATTTPNDITVALQVPSYLFIAISEIFASITGLEYAYTKAPESMKSIVMSLFLFTNAGGSILNFAFLPALYDPFIQYMYTIIACIMIATAFIFLYCFNHYDNDVSMGDTFVGRDEEEAGEVH
ncbi:peptide transporter ptr2 [Dimargaris verticillata]|uniref:Peptide transporter ptr2 n=1 Tax=Dimargaris verticillata TaxID=2761393 RepID=A0A9W8B5U9_9FUNG|nr:peptide transporter ptr2 [Dimargaris verticillata]